MIRHIPDAVQRLVSPFVTEAKWPREVVEELINYRNVAAYSKGAILFRQGAPADVFFWIVSGNVHIFYPRPAGERILVRLCGPGEIIGYVDFIDDKRRRSQLFEAQAASKCEAVLLTREHVHKLLSTLAPEQLVGLIETLNTMWSSAAQAWSSFIGLDYRERLEQVISDLARRFGVEDARGTLVIPELMHAQLAAMIGSSRPMVTRLINDMIGEHIIERRGKQYVLLKPLALDSDRHSTSKVAQPQLRTIFASNQAPRPLASSNDSNAKHALDLRGARDGVEHGRWNSQPNPSVRSALKSRG